MPVRRQGGFSNRYLTRVLAGPLPDFVYAVSDGEGVKVGRTAEHPLERLRDLQVGNPRVLVLLAWTTTISERQAHRKLWRHRVRGEWFRPHPALLAELRTWDWIDERALAAAESGAPVAGLEQPSV
jgi:hypothetical protein